MVHVNERQHQFIPCNLCGSRESVPIRNKGRDGVLLRSVICRECGLVWSDPRPTPQELRAYYENQYRLDYKGELEPKAKHVYRSGKVAVDRFKRLRNFLPPGCAILDVGAGSGEMVYVFRAMGFQATGFEPNEGYAKYAANVLGLPIKPGFWQEVVIESGSQHVVTMFHALEHMESPIDVVRHVRRWLHPDGLLVVEVPNVEAMCQHPFSQFHPGHLYHFNHSTLERLCLKAGFQTVSRFTSKDGGNIMIIARMTSNDGAVTGGFPENYKHVETILNGHSPLRHMLTPHPYIRPVRKLVARLEERWHAGSKSNPREVLDHLIAAKLR